jgi:hypothetical protein
MMVRAPALVLEWRRLRRVAGNMNESSRDWQWGFRHVGASAQYNGLFESQMPAVVGRRPVSAGGRIAGRHLNSTNCGPDICRFNFADPTACPSLPRSQADLAFPKALVDFLHRTHFTSKRTWTLRCPFAERPVKRTRFGKAEVDGDVTDAAPTVQQPVDRETTADFVLDGSVGLAFLMQTAAGDCRAIGGAVASRV